MESAAQLRDRLRHPPNAVADTGINLRPGPRGVLALINAKPGRPLKSALPSDDPNDVLRFVFNRVAERYGLCRRDIRTSRSHPRAIAARMVAIYLSKRIVRVFAHMEWKPATNSDIARMLRAGRTTVASAEKSVIKRMEVSPEFQADIESLEQKIRERLR